MWPGIVARLFHLSQVYLTVSFITMACEGRCVLLSDEQFLKEKLDFAKSHSKRLSQILRELRSVISDGENHFECSPCVDILRILIQDLQLESVLEAGQTHLLSRIRFWSGKLHKLEAYDREKKPVENDCEENWPEDVPVGGEWRSEEELGSMDRSYVDAYKGEKEEDSPPSEKWRNDEELEDRPLEKTEGALGCSKKLNTRDGIATAKWGDICGCRVF